MRRTAVIAGLQAPETYLVPELSQYVATSAQALKLRVEPIFTDNRSGEPVIITAALNTPIKIADALYDEGTHVLPATIRAARVTNVGLGPVFINSGRRKQSDETPHSPTSASHRLNPGETWLIGIGIDSADTVAPSQSGKRPGLHPWALTMYCLDGDARIRVTAFDADGHKLPFYTISGSVKTITSADGSVDIDFSDDAADFYRGLGFTLATAVAGDRTCTDTSNPGFPEGTAGVRVELLAAGSAGAPVLFDTTGYHPDAWDGDVAGEWFTNKGIAPRGGVVPTAINPDACLQALQNVGDVLEFGVVPNASAQSSSAGGGGDWDDFAGWPHPLSLAVYSATGDAVLHVRAYDANGLLLPFFTAGPTISNNGVAVYDFAAGGGQTTNLWSLVFGLSELGFCPGGDIPGLPDGTAYIEVTLASLGTGTGVHVAAIGMDPRTYSGGYAAAGPWDVAKGIDTRLGVTPAAIPTTSNPHQLTTVGDTLTYGKGATL